MIGSLHATSNHVCWEMTRIVSLSGIFMGVAGWMGLRTVSVTETGLVFGIGNGFEEADMFVSLGGLPILSVDNWVGIVNRYYRVAIRSPKHCP